MLRRGWRRVGHRAVVMITGLKKADGLITGIATVLLAAITAMLAQIAYWQYTDTTLRETLVASNRAWLAPTGLAVRGQIDGDKDLDIDVHYANVGKGPAIKVKLIFAGGTIPNLADPLIPAAGPNSTCAGQQTDPGGPVVFPNTPNNNWWNSTIIPRTLLTQSVKDNKAVLYLQGCLIYETMKEVHHTWFCQFVYRNGKLASQAATSHCKDGNGAD